MADQVGELLDRHGRTFAAEAGITLRDKPAPLCQLLVLTLLLSVRIKAEIAVAAAGELFRAGWRTPAALRESSWQQRVDALGRAHYKRYDEGTATNVGKAADLLRDRWRDDLRRMRAEADGDTRTLHKLITEFPRIGETGAHIFCREVQAVWPELRPYFDRRALAGAERLGLPADPAALAGLVSESDLARLAAALVRADLEK
jgi:hypothetical protein